ncbi:dephospho-CoA kinase [Floridanema aerugineum]|uniref:Dephospho-CoA kinase n=1 Tax=Floridaenema aerugineum BLCC-F46 TaxID=3153654 RepID=A0ABV4WYS7_9CYAN
MTQRKIGLTGGISTGKTTVSNYLANTYQLPILDADIYAREAVQIGSPILNKIAQRYGTEILLPDGALNRQKLGEIVFRDNEERIWLEQQIHPYVRQRFAEAMNQLPSNSTVVLVIPLLFEAKLTGLVTEIWVVFVDEQQQIERLMQRNNLTLEQAKARISSQMSLAQKCQKADVILDNSGSLSYLYQQIDAALTS